MHAGIFQIVPYKTIKGTRVLSLWEWQQLISTPKKYQFKHKKLKNLHNKTSFIDVLQRLESDHENRRSNVYFRYFIERNTP